jgi:hypothetical protein
VFGKGSKKERGNISRCYFEPLRGGGVKRREVERRKLKKRRNTEER